MPSELHRELDTYLFWGDESNDFTGKVCSCRLMEITCYGPGRGGHRPNRGAHVSSHKCRVPGHHVTKCGACEDDIRWVTFLHMRYWDVLNGGHHIV